MQDGDPPANDPDAVFSMDPEATIWALARQLVEGQQTLAKLFAEARAAAAAVPDAPEILGLLADLEKLRASWYAESLPSLVASMQLAIEVFDTNGPGVTTISDAVEAAAYNNKYFVWAKELAVDQ
jgi:hypothetical protein